jgi:hypothetical protein
MARAITFFPKQMYMGPNSGSLVNLSDIFEVTEEGKLDVEFRVYGSYLYTATSTGTVVTTSDPTFLDANWKTLSGTFTVVGQGIAVVTGLTGLGRFVRAKLEVPNNSYCCACMNGVLRAI